VRIRYCRTILSTDYSFNAMASEKRSDHVSTPSPSYVKVAVIEDHREFREYLVALISGAEGFRCTGSYRSMEEARDKIPFELPDVVLVDIGLPGMSGVDGVRLLRDRYPQLVLLMQTVYEDDERIFDALCAGASGYLLKKTQPARLLESLREAASGGAPMSPEVAQRVIRLFREIRPPERSDYNLTPHELRILRLLVEGHNYKTAAAELKVTTSTINFHLQKIYEKLQVHSKSEAVAKALRNRLV
jgi:DNA-binding NarL/FixJ family response regulator